MDLEDGEIFEPHFTRRDMAYHIAGVLHRTGNGVPPSELCVLLQEECMTIYEGISCGQAMGLLHLQVHAEPTREPLIWIV